MYFCICNKITEKELEENPLLWLMVGTQCGMCLFDGGDQDFDGANENLSDNAGDDDNVNKNNCKR
jgi:hypothetical protein